MRSSGARALSVCFMVLFVALSFTVPAATVESDRTDGVSIWRVYIDGPDDLATLTGGDYDLVEGKGDGYYLVVGDDATALSLQANGLRAELDRDLPPLPPSDNKPYLFNGGYKTTVEMESYLDQVAGRFPNLATVYDYGDSWLKTQGRPGGNDLKVICLTGKKAGDCQLNPDSAKPRAVIIGAVHARELQTSELTIKLIDELTQKYETDADIRYLMDTVETWIIPVANPDGRQIVERGGNNPHLQRKNANDSRGRCRNPPSTFSQVGVDLNRNATVDDFGQAGTSTRPCSETYRGTGPASEPEQQALESLFKTLWKDRKGARNEPVQPGTTGVMVSLHSFGDLMLFSPASGGVTPNDRELRSFAFRMSHYNNYETGTPAEILYSVTGSTDEFSYYNLGVASFTYEIGPSGGNCSGFVPAYSCLESEIWPKNREALLYAIRVAGNPYEAPLGPTVESVPASSTVIQGDFLGFNTVINDDAFGDRGRSRPSASIVAGAQFSVDSVPGTPGASPIGTWPQDGAFDSAQETAVGFINTTTLEPGSHTAYVRGRNANGSWGPVHAFPFEVTPRPAPVNGVVYAADFEGSNEGWDVNPYGVDSASSGAWGGFGARQVQSGPIAVQPARAASGSRALFTGDNDDVDGGETTIMSPPIRLPFSGNIEMDFSSYMAHRSDSAAEDYFRVYLLGQQGFVLVSEETGAADDDGAEWQNSSFDISWFAGQTIRVFVQAGDSGADSVVEAGFDDFKITVD